MMLKYAAFHKTIKNFHDPLAGGSPTEMKVLDGL